MAFDDIENGSEFLKLQSLEKDFKKFETIGDTIKSKEIKNQLKQRLINHKGFSKDVLVYNTITKTINKIGELPYGVVTAPIVKWNDDFFIISGEISPGVRTPFILKGHINIPPSKFGWLNTVVLIVYLDPKLGFKGVLITYPLDLLFLPSK